MFPEWPPRPVDPDELLFRSRGFLDSEQRYLKLVEQTNIEAMKINIMAHFYLRGGWLPLHAYGGDRIGNNVVYTSVTGLPGSGKHSIISTIYQKSDLSSPVATDLIVPHIKRQFRTTTPGEQLTEQWISLSLLGYHELLQQLRQPDQKTVFSHQGPVGVWNSLMLFFGEEDFSRLLQDPIIDQAVWHTDSLEQLANQYPELIDQTWSTMLSVWQRGQSAQTFPWFRWPLVAQPSPIILISRLSPKQCWSLQEKQSSIRRDSRPFGPHPFTPTQIKILRLILRACFATLTLLLNWQISPEF